MQFEPPTYTSQFGYPQGTYHAYGSPPGMSHPNQPFYEAGYGVPTPAPSPLTPSTSRRRSNTAAQDFIGAEYMNNKRPSSRRAGPHEGYSEFDHRTATSPRPGTNHTRLQPGFMHTPLHTPPPPSSHAHSGTPMPHGTHMPNIYAYGFTGPQGEYVSSFYPGNVRKRQTEADSGSVSISALGRRLS